ncbi:MAG: AfsR/SARP family transcriptional regulator, partial [Spirillospora sp.]
MADEKPGLAGETYRFEVLGPMRIERDGDAVTPPRSPILRGILGALLVAGSRPLTAARLVDLVWEDRDERVAPGAVQVAVSRLRGWLRRTGPAGESSWTLAHDGNGYRLLVPDGAVDLCRFRASVKRAAACEAERICLLKSALTLWRGPVLADSGAVDLTDPLFRAVDDEVQATAMALADAALQAGRPTGVIDLLSALAEAYPLHEGIEGRMLELLAHDGRAAEALARYRVFHDRVVEELGVEPGERVHRAYLSALSRDHERPPVPDTAAAGSAVPVPAQLPPDVSDFVGRSEQVATLSR